jgi:tyrosine-protein phosphatase SIW14
VVKTLYCAALLAFSLSASAQPAQLERIDDHIYRGRQPNQYDFPVLANMGIKTVLDLRGGSIHVPWERKHAEGAGLQYISIRLSGIWAPHDDQVAQVLKVLSDKARWPIFIHCLRGDDRIGLVIACYHIAYDHWTNQQALDDARNLGLNRFEFLMQRYIMNYNPNRGSHPPSPETGSQRTGS